MDMTSAAGCTTTRTMKMINRIILGLCNLRHYLYHKTGRTYGPWACNKAYERGLLNFPVVDLSDAISPI